jgi:hypothetical protein
MYCTRACGCLLHIVSMLSTTSFCPAGSCPINPERDLQQHHAHAASCTTTYTQSHPGYVESPTPPPHLPNSRHAAGMLPCAAVASRDCCAEPRYTTHAHNMGRPCHSGAAHRCAWPRANRAPQQTEPCLATNTLARVVFQLHCTPTKRVAGPLMGRQPPTSRHISPVAGAAGYCPAGPQPDQTCLPFQSTDPPCTGTGTGKAIDASRRSLPDKVCTGNAQLVQARPGSAAVTPNKVLGAQRSGGQPKRFRGREHGVIHAAGWRAPALWDTYRATCVECALVWQPPHPSIRPSATSCIRPAHGPHNKASPGKQQPLHPAARAGNQAAAQHPGVPTFLLPLLLLLLLLLCPP